MMAAHLSHLDGTHCPGLTCETCMLATILTGNLYLAVSDDGTLARDHH